MSTASFSDERRTLYNNKGSIQQENVTLVNIYAPNLGAPKYIYIANTNIHKEINSNKVIVMDFNIPVIAMHQPF